jgi:hypothetical protein
VGLQLGGGASRFIKRVTPVPSPTTAVDKLEFIEISGTSPKEYYIASIATALSPTEGAGHRYVLTGQAVGTVAETDISFWDVDVSDAPAVAALLGHQKWFLIEP